MKLAKLESAMRQVLAFHEAFNRHDVAGMMQLLSEDCIFEGSVPAPDGVRYSGKEEVTRYWRDFFHESPQAKMHIEDAFGLGLRCVLCWRYEWVDDAGASGHVRGVDIFRVEDGLIRERLSYTKG